MKLDKFIRIKREQRGITLREMAAASTPYDVSPTAIHSFECGRNTDMKVTTLLGMAKALKVPPGVIIAAIKESLSVEELTDA